jgi:hypothetical protein
MSVAKLFLPFSYFSAPQTKIARAATGAEAAKKRWRLYSMERKPKSSSIRRNSGPRNAGSSAMRPETTRTEEVARPASIVERPTTSQGVPAECKMYGLQDRRTSL